MNCPSCGEETPDHGKFCLHCGAPLTTDSPSSKSAFADALQKVQEGSASDIGIFSRPSEMAPVNPRESENGGDLLRGALEAKDAPPVTVRRAPDKSKSDIPAQWEEYEYVYTFPKGMWVRLADTTSNGYTVVGARAEFWSLYRQAILADLQTWLDKGWRPIGPIDSDCIQVKTRTKSTMGTAGKIICILLIPLILVSLTLWLISFAQVAIPVDFRIILRRLQTETDSQAMLP